MKFVLVVLMFLVAACGKEKMDSPSNAPIPPTIDSDLKAFLPAGDFTEGTLTTQPKSECSKKSLSELKSSMLTAQNTSFQNYVMLERESEPKAPQRDYFSYDPNVLKMGQGVIDYCTRGTGTPSLPGYTSRLEHLGSKCPITGVMETRKAFFGKEQHSGEMFVGRYRVRDSEYRDLNMIYEFWFRGTSYRVIEGDLKKSFLVRNGKLRARGYDEEISYRHEITVEADEINQTWTTAHTFTFETADCRGTLHSQSGVAAAD